jgi:hypothetical protein
MRLIRAWRVEKPLMLITKIFFYPMNLVTSMDVEGVKAAVQKHASKKSLVVVIAAAALLLLLLFGERSPIAL